MSGNYRISFNRQAEKDLAALPQKMQERIAETIDKLAHNPRPSGATKMSGFSSWRIRIDDCRVIYNIKDDVLTVLVLNIGHRREVYR